MNGHVYSQEPQDGANAVAAIFRVPGQYMRGTMTDEEYAKKEQGRDHFTVTLNLTPQEGEKVALSLQHFDGSYYSALAHNCTMPMQQALKGIGLSIPLPLITPDSFVQTLTDNGLVKEVKDR